MSDGVGPPPPPLPLPALLDQLCGQPACAGLLLQLMQRSAEEAHRLRAMQLLTLMLRRDPHVSSGLAGACHA